MKEIWRPYGPEDPITLDATREAGAVGVVTSLCHIHPDVGWDVGEVQVLKTIIEAAGLTWDVVESIRVPNSVELGNADWQARLETFRTSLRAAAAGTGMVCYNFVPTFDWTRTRTNWPASTGQAMRFDFDDFVAFDLFVRKRPGVELAYSGKKIEAARAAYQSAQPEMLEEISSTVWLGLPSNLNVTSNKGIREKIAQFDGMAHQDIAGNLQRFLRATGPDADELGVNLGIHPDDPPFPVFGLPRIVSNGDDLQRKLDAYVSPRNGITFCTGSLGASPGNDTLALFERFAHSVNSLHLRNVTIDRKKCFIEDDHLSGQTDMVALIASILSEERRRKTEGRNDAVIPIRPDHGHLNARDDDMGSPRGYSYIGRLEGLAELRDISAVFAG